MVEKKRSLDSEDLARLRKLVSRKNNGSLPLEELAAIADLPEETGVTIDFEAEAELGHPLVVLRPNDNVSSTLAGLSTRELEVAAVAAAAGQLGRTNEARAAAAELLEVLPEVGNQDRAMYASWNLSDELVDALIDGLGKAGIEGLD